MGWLPHWCRRRRLLSIMGVFFTTTLLSLLYFFYTPISLRFSAHQHAALMDMRPLLNHSGTTDDPTFLFSSSLSPEIHNWRWMQGHGVGERMTGDRVEDSSDHNDEKLANIVHGDAATVGEHGVKRTDEFLREAIIRTNNGWVNRTLFLEDFEKEMVDVFSDRGEESDYLFSRCQNDAATFQSNKIYGFVGPFRYLANYKNPCWMQPGGGEAPEVNCVPYFYLVGAPKAGSTDVYTRITKHPEVVKPASKETRWFDRSRYTGKPHFSSFLRNFNVAANVIARSLDKGSNYHRRIVGDGSPSYFFDNRNWPYMPGNEGCEEPRVTVASHIHHLFPQARIIFVLRNPVDRLYSSYLFNHAKYEAVSTRTFDLYVREAIKLYRDCFARYSVRMCANNATVFQQAKVMLIVSLYSVFVQDWLALFPREQLFFMTTENYNQHMSQHLGRMFAFLGLRELTGTEMDMITDHKPFNQGQHYKKTGMMLKETRDLLEDFYRPYNQQLAHLLNDPQFLWMS